MKFTHMGDCHLGGWRQPELMKLNMDSFRFAIDTSIKEKVSFILIAGDLFDSAYPPIEIIKDAFREFKKIYDAGIPVFLIAGSHDYSVAGKSFLDVLEQAGFVKNVFQKEDRNGFIYLLPTLYKNVAIYGYPGKKSGLEVDDIGKIRLHEAPGLFSILMLHTTIRDAIGSLPIPAVEHEKLPKTDYLALAHLHINYQRQNRIYCGPTFPNNALELEELQGGSFYISDTSGKFERREIKLKDVKIFDFKVENAQRTSEQIKEELKKHDLKDKIVILRLSGTIIEGKLADINFKEVDSQASKQGAFTILKNLSRLQIGDSAIPISLSSENLEENILKEYIEKNNTDLNKLIIPLFSVLQVEKKEDERTAIFEERLLEEARRVLQL
ncbi:MAG: metallophosphoesterase [Nanoarchaeota archaeon]